MNRELKRVSILVLLMFVALMCSTSILQVFQVDNLNADSRNARTLYDSYSAQRGPILVAGKPIAESVPSKDQYKFQRTYPDARLYSSVTGYFTLNQGRTGIEGALNDRLSGTSNSQFLGKLNNIFTGKIPQGASAELTIDPVAQKAAYDSLGNQQGAIVVLEPKTGRILAMVSKPDYDPNVLASHDTSKVISAYKSLLAAKGDPLINRTITGNMDPPGSSFKPVVSAAAFATGDFTPDSQLPNLSELHLPGTDAVVYNDPRGTCGPGKTVSIATAEIRSCNIPFAELGMKLGAKTIRDQANLFGFNRSLKIPMKVAKSAYPLYTDPAATAMSAFGQRDDRATPMQMAMVSAGIANGGTVMYPNLVQSVTSSDLKPLETFTPKKLDRAMSSEDAAKLTTMMVDGVNTGAADNARIDGVSVAGKTGTAQNGVGKPYSLWFTGFAPANDPKYAIAVVVQNGGGLGQSGIGNTVAVPIAKKVLEAVLNK